jgi:polysaccharide biosynthesis/export protein
VGGSEPSFTAFGAFKSVGEFKFEPGQLTLAQALGRTGGLLDDRADPRNVYLVRKYAYVYPPQLQLKDPVPVASPASPKAVIYRINLKDVSNFVLMQQFQMQNGDILFATNASSVDWAKLLTVFQKSVPTAAAPLPSPPSMPAVPSMPSAPSVTISPGGG